MAVTYIKNARDLEKLSTQCVKNKPIPQAEALLDVLRRIEPQLKKKGWEIVISNGGTNYGPAPSVLVDGHDATDQTLNIPNAYLMEALATGGVAMLAFADAKKRFGTPAWQRYEAFVARLAGQTQAARVRTVHLRRQ